MFGLTGPRCCKRPLSRANGGPDSVALTRARSTSRIQVKGTSKNNVEPSGAQLWRRRQSQASCRVVRMGDEWGAS
uniref:Uncharacterized protein n=1 Tax=Knipowitschia caucasica TaxID=637954 RepID=A0AAV2J9D0_KNICA